MMKGRFKLWLPVLLFCISSFCYAEISDNSLNKLLDLSGMTKQVGQFSQAIKAGIAQAQQQSSPIPDQDYKAILISVDQSIVSSEILAEIRASLKKTLSEEEAKQLFTWYETDLGKEITQAEERASTYEAQMEMMRMADSFLEDLERLEYALRLDMALGLTRMTMDFNKQASIATYSAVMANIQPDVPLDLEPLKAKMKAERDETREAIQGMVLLSLVYAYKDIEIDKLKKYEVFLKDPVTVKFTKEAMKGMNRAFASSITKFTNTLITLLQNKKQT